MENSLQLLNQPNKFLSLKKKRVFLILIILGIFLIMQIQIKTISPISKIIQSLILGIFLNLPTLTTTSSLNKNKRFNLNHNKKCRHKKNKLRRLTYWIWWMSHQNKLKMQPKLNSNKKSKIIKKPNKKQNKSQICLGTKLSRIWKVQEINSRLTTSSKSLRNKQISSLNRILSSHLNNKNSKLT